MLTIVREKDGVEVKLLGGHFSVQLTEDQKRWLACEGEAKSMQLVLMYFEAYLRENKHVTLHLTDSLPVVMAWKKILTGRFSSSPRIATFLSTLASFPIRVEHRSGAHMMITDHASRNPPPPCEGNCQLCKFIAEDAVEGDLAGQIYSIDEEGKMEDGQENVPYLQLKTWRSLQSNDPVHTRLCSLIKSGQEPEKRRTGGMFTEIKHLHTLFLRDSLKIHSSGVVMVRSKTGHYDGFAISVPSELFMGIAFMFHKRLNHPKRTQLIKFLSRYFYVPALANMVDKVTSSCIQCLATAKLPRALIEDTTQPPDAFGTSFCADVMERNQQQVFVVKEILTQFTLASLIPDQTASSLREALITSVAPLLSLQGGEVRVDSAPGFQSIQLSQDTDPVLKDLKLKLVIGEPLNKNSNPSGEGVIAELKREIVNVVSQNHKLDPALLALATRNLNLRVRAENKTAFERLTSRDSLSGENFVQNDRELLNKLIDRRKGQHLANEKHNLKHSVTIPEQKFHPGDLVMYRELHSADKKRDTFMVVSQEGNQVTIRKMSEQLRLKTYTVKSQQLILTMSATQLLTQHPPDQPSQPLPHPITPPPTPPQQESLTISSPTARPSRKAGRNARRALHSMKKSKLISIQTVEKAVISALRNSKRKVGKKQVDDDEKFVTILSYSQVQPDAHPPPQRGDNQQPNRDPDQDFLNQFWMNGWFPPMLDENQEDIIPNRSIQDESEGQLDSTTDSDASNDHNIARFLDFSSSDTSLSVCTMSTSTRRSLIDDFQRSDTGESLAWDNDESLLRLQDSPVLSPTTQGSNPWSDSSSNGTDDVFNNDISFATSSPYSERRVTRSMLSSASTLSPRLDRNDIFRRRLRVHFADRNLVMISDEIPNQQTSTATHSVNSTE